MNPRMNEFYIDSKTFTADAIKVFYNLNLMETSYSRRVAWEDQGEHPPTAPRIAIIPLE